MSSRIAAIAALGALALAPTTVQAATPKTSLTAIWNDYMCTACHEPLPVAQSPEAYSERSFLAGLIAQGLTKAQIQRQMVAAYSPAVLARPPAHGFNLSVYVLPPAIVVLGLAVLAFTLPRWRRRAAAAAARPPTAAPSLSPADEQRLDEDLGHYPG